jgi:hypothetical protein
MELASEKMEPPQYPDPSPDSNRQFVRKCSISGIGRFVQDMDFPLHPKSAAMAMRQENKVLICAL